MDILNKHIGKSYAIYNADTVEAIQMIPNESVHLHSTAKMVSATAD